jgi:hypothetical protein
MSLAKLVQNDLHYDNVWIVPLYKTVTVNYFINDETYVFPIRYLVKLYDFDRAYAVRFGPNPLLDDATCFDVTHCNKFISNLDAVKVSTYVYATTTIDANKELLKWILSKEETKESQTKVRAFFAQDFDDYRRMKGAFIYQAIANKTLNIEEDFAQVDRIISKIYYHMSSSLNSELIRLLKERTETKNFYLDKQYFDFDGSIKPVDDKVWGFQYIEPSKVYEDEEISKLPFSDYLEDDFSLSSYPSSEFKELPAFYNDT